MYLKMTHMKLHMLLAMALTTVLFTNCTKEEVVIPNKTVIRDIRANQWTLTGDNTYRATLDVPEMTPHIVDIGGVTVAASFDNGGLYEALPQVFQGVTYLYSYEDGRVHIDVQSADGTDPIKLTSTVRIKIVIIESQD